MESDFLGWLRSRLPTHPQLRLGPGDDAAVLRLADRSDVVVTCDLVSDHIDFNLEQASPRRIGHKALAVNLSDLAAMAAEPLAVVIALLLPKDNAAELARKLYLGLIPLAERYGIAIAGGDTNTWPGPLAISVTALGQTTARGPLLRSGAKPGDAILVTGAFGGSILGRHLDVEPRCQEALQLHRDYELNAGLDCSDGLAKDLWRICQASNCGAVVDTACIPLQPAAYQLASQSGRSPLEHALHDGEDFELILAVPQDVATELLRRQPLRDLVNQPVPLTKIGEFIRPTEFWQCDAQGNRSPLLPQGYEH